MKYLEILRAQLAAKITERETHIQAMEAITAGAEAEQRSTFSDVEQTRFDEAIVAVKVIDEERSTLSARIAELEEIEAGRQAADDATRSAAPFVAPHVARGRDPWDTGEIRFSNRAELHGQVRSALEALDASDDDKAAIDLKVRRFDSAGGDLARRVLITGSPLYRSAFAKVIAGNPEALTDAERSKVAEMRAASLTDAAGGYAVPTTLDPTIIDTGDGSVNPFRQLATVRTTVTDQWQGVTSAGVTASWDGEAAEVSDDAPTLASAPIPVHKAQAFVPFSIEIGQDWANMDADIRSMFAVAKDDLEATAFATGTGSSQPTGIVKALDGGSSEVAPLTAETFVVGDLYALEEALPAKYRARASWVANKAIYNDIRQFGTSDSHALWERIGAGQPAQLLGYNAYEASAMDNGFNAAATADNFLLILGDFANYVIVDRVGMSVELIPHLFATGNNRPSGQRGLYAYWRTGADSVNDGAFRMLNVATAA